MASWKKWQKEQRDKKRDKKINVCSHSTFLFQASTETTLDYLILSFSWPEQPIPTRVYNHPYQGAVDYPQVCEKMFPLRSRNCVLLAFLGVIKKSV